MRTTHNVPLAPDFKTIFLFAGDEITLRAICCAFGCRVRLVTSHDQKWIKHYEPSALKTEKYIFLAYIAPVHYNSIAIKDRQIARITNEPSSQEVPNLPPSNIPKHVAEETNTKIKITGRPSIRVLRKRKH
jgi:hypothetical protein